MDGHRLLVTTREATRLLGCSRQTLMSLRDQGRLHPIQIGRGKRRPHYRWRMAELEALGLTGDRETVR
ncbi:MAG: helix-turn-helix domain-containing protein [Pirellulales bacterium]|nr:helix-turn-helix domain-containing protein [Pirellulales bacterium]